MTNIGEGLRVGWEPQVSLFVPGRPVSPTLTFEFADVVPAKVYTFVLEIEDQNRSPFSVVTEYELVFNDPEDLPADLNSYLEQCLVAASRASKNIVWLGFEGSFNFDNLLTEDVAPEIYGVCAPGGEPVVAPDLETLKTPDWRATISSFGKLF